MNIMQNKSIWIATALALLMGVTRFNHFGSATMLPDASYAVFFLGGVYLGRTRFAMALLAFLMIEAALVDYYVINFRDVSGWCVTSAYGFLLLAYAGLWFIGRWYAPRHDLTGKGLLGLSVTAVAAASLAFVIANVSFYLLAGYFGNMSAMEYSARVAQYFVPYIAVAVMYIGGAIILQMMYAILTGKQHGAKAF
ncbi:hypothetical protein [Sideroxydans lithotrophicus]|uniref:Transmembrane protein n=1 Tax=Sideroxydans lithotrophicus (strain ES-1) TaxID=580332 RepID=D5CNY4_SIDLE|nr:hypothetical protein [Sideroxydans lithotrophicus]ADE12905.1 conserved hypothetical protein [Sideroxydans lithotrophicus ES-1]